MKTLWDKFFNCGIAAKLMILFSLFGLIPIATVGYMGYSAVGEIEKTVGENFQGVASNVADKIDRNLFERYGDAQAFGKNRIVQERYNWYVPNEHDNQITQVMNEYMALYGIYSLSLFVDPDGDLIAVNSRDAQGQSIDTSALYKNNYKHTPWFQALAAGTSTTKMPFSAPGNDVSTGTFIEDVHIDPDVKATYPGDDGLTLGFSAPVYHDGDLIGYWSNRARFSLVEEIVKTAYQELKASGYPGSEMTIMDGQGRAILDYRPQAQGSQDIVHDFQNILMKLNLPEHGVAAAKAAIEGRTGWTIGPHERTQISQVVGYTHLKGALGYPGMNWSIVVRAPESEAAGAALAYQQTLLGGALVFVGLILVAGFVIGRRAANYVAVVQAAADRMARGDYTVRIPVHAKDELGRLGEAFNAMAGGIQQRVQELARANEEMTILKAALENAGTNIMIADASDNVIFVNKAAHQALHSLEGELARYIPGFRADQVVGGSIHRYHKNPDAIRQILGRLGPDDVRRGEITPGPFTFRHATRGVFDEQGRKLAHLVEWVDSTGEKKAQEEIQKLIAGASAGRLTDRIAVETFDGFFKQIGEGINRLLETVVTPLTEAQRVLEGVAQGDLTRTMEGAYEGEYDRIKASVNTAIHNLASTVTTVREAAEHVHTAAREISQGTDDLSERTSEQASALEETSATMEEMTSTVKQNADNAKQAQQLALAARGIAEKGGTITAQAVNAMAEINHSSRKIADIINVIDEIAFQTNLLALNAAVEAARAGEQGRGFAVVASEVRNLAQRSATAAKEIKSLIHESVQKVTDGSTLVNESGATLKDIVASVQRVTDIMSEMAAASQEQACGIDQVNKAIMQMDQTTQQNAALVEETAAAAQSMQQRAADLTRLVEFFQVKTVSGHRSHDQMGLQTAHPHSQASGAPTKAGGDPRERLAASGASRSAKSKEPVGVGTGNGHAHRAKEDDLFEEF